MNADLREVAARLYQFGWFNRTPEMLGPDGKPDWDKIKFASVDTILAAMDGYAKFNGLPSQARQAGTAVVAADALVKALQTRRCGFPDLLTADAARAKWQFPDVKFHDGIVFNGVDPKMVAEAYRLAWKQWGDVCGLTPKPVMDRRQANVYAHAGKIDRAGSVLAYAYFPSAGSRDESNEQLYDTSDAQSYATFNFLLAVACHETGHSIGLPHGPAGKCLMGPYIGNYVKPHTFYDIPEALARYGKPVPHDDDPPPPPLDPVPLFQGMF